MTGDPAALARFVEAQARDYDTALAELEAGRKRSHWIWYVLPQLRGLGVSPMAAHYGIADLAEARTYLAHPVLGPRLHACVAAILRHRDTAARTILGTPDDLKFRSCLTLFEAAAGDGPGAGAFAEALDAFYGGERDGRTLALIGHSGGGAP
ncbi:MAG: DUF1810 domain-containing protein [Pseudomonadota bacterium]